MPTNRDRALDAAIELLSEEGIRSLTHLRVDRRAGLPKGSSSNAFRTREALLVGVCEAMVASEAGPVAALRGAKSADELSAALVELFEEMVGPGRRVTSARLALLVEAGHDEAVRAALAQGRSAIEAPVLAAFAELRAPDPELAVQVVAVCFEGLFLHVFGGYAAVDPAPIIDAAVRAAFTPGTRPPGSRPARRGR